MSGQENYNSSKFRYLGLSVAITAFLLLFRPFGMSIDNLASAIVVLGLIPLNFLIMATIHSIPLAFKVARRRFIFFTFLISIANIIYLQAFTGKWLDIELALNVVVTVGLAMCAISLWMSQQALKVRLSAFEGFDVNFANETIILAEGGDRNILRLAPSAFLFVKAERNYVLINYEVQGDMREHTLRLSLKAVLETVPKGVLLQCHRSYAVNPRMIERFEVQNSTVVLILGNGTQVPVSRTFRENIMKIAKI